MIIFSLAIVFAGAMDYFSKNAKAVNLNVKISVNDQKPWIETFNWENFLPGESKRMNLIIKNIGTDPAKVWKRINNLTAEENGVVEPEGAWYDENGINRAVGKNDADSVIDYDMKIGSKTIVNGEAGAVLQNVKGAYMFLGELASGAEMTVEEGYYLKSDTGNWMQSDKMTFDIEILALSLDAPVPSERSTLFMENKKVLSNWSPIDSDGKMGILRYDPVAPAFNFDFLGTGLAPNKEYCLIYYADPYPGNNPGALIGSGNSNIQGILALSGSNDLGMDLPSSPDANLAKGAKIWLLPCANYNKITHAVIWGPNENDWYFERAPEYIRYTRGTLPPPIETKTIRIDALGGDILNQYGYNIDYSNADVSFSYDTPAAGKLRGEISATGLKPYATYQVKFGGKPVCQFGGAGNDLANEYIGYKGRWTCVSGATCTGGAAARNRSDAQYAANKAKLDGDPTKECIASYLVWDFFTADASGSADKAVESASSFHALFANGGVCNSTDNSHLSYLDPAHPSVLFALPADVEGQLERGTCKGMILNAGDYDLKISLTEESFHQGNWATVLVQDISFAIE